MAKSSPPESKTWLYVLGAVVLVGIILVGWVVGTYNSLVSLSAGADKAWSNVETDYQRRFDLIPNLVETVKGIAKQEQSVFTEIAQLRSQWAATSDPSEKQKIAQASDGALGRLIAVSEAYPELKSNENFLALQDQLEGSENRITVSRQRYNEAVNEYNVKIMRIPSNMIAALFNFEKKDLFNAVSGAENAPKVQF